MSDPSSSTAMASTSNTHDEEGVDYGDDMDDHDGDGRRAQEDMTDEDKELEAMKARVREMEAEAAKLREMQAVAEKERSAAQEGSVTPIEGGAAFPTEEEQQEIDARSIFVKNVGKFRPLLIDFSRSHADNLYPLCLQVCFKYVNCQAATAIQVNITDALSSSF
jgi:hypothetical protein